MEGLEGLGLRVQGEGFRGFRVEGLEGLEGLGFTVEGLMCLGLRA